MLRADGDLLCYRRRSTGRSGEVLGTEVLSVPGVPSSAARVEICAVPLPLIRVAG